jgi:hypothetical protein
MELFYSFDGVLELGGMEDNSKTILTTTADKFERICIP